MIVKFNQIVPNFSAIISDNQTIKLSDYHGKNVILYFYPKDNTTGCTQEANDFKEYQEKFESLNAVILGISRDSAKSHHNFRCKYALPFELIADKDGELCQLFDVLKPKMMYGKSVIGIERSTFLIDSAGMLVREWRKVKIEGHCIDVLNALSAIVTD